MGVLINLIISGIGIFAGALIAFYFYRKSMFIYSARSLFTLKRNERALKLYEYLYNDKYLCDSLSDKDYKNMLHLYLRTNKTNEAFDIIDFLTIRKIKIEWQLLDMFLFTCLNQGRIDDAYKIWRQYEKYNDIKNLFFLSPKALLLAKIGFKDKSMQILEKLIADGYSNYLTIGIIYDSCEEFAKALIYYKKCLKSENLTTVYWGNNNIGSIWNLKYKNDPHSKKSELYRCRAYKYYNKAINILKSDVEAFKGAPSAINALTNILELEKDLNKRIEYQVLAFEINPYSHVIDTAIAYTYILTVRDTQKGVKFARKAHKIYKDEWTYQVLIYAYIKDKKFTKALNLAKEAIKRFHDYKYADFKLCICIVQCHMGLMRVAFKNMVEIYSLEFNNGILELLFHSYYVKLLQYFGRFEDARSVCDEYLEKFPDNNELSNMSRNLFLYFITQNNNPLSEL